jgi:hypothetical protein
MMILKRSILFIAAAVLAAQLGSVREQAESTQENRREQASFPHNKPEHRKIECSKCHTVTVDRPNVDAMPGHSSCISCHNFAAMAFSTEPVMFCAICHNGRPGSKLQAALFRFPKPGIRGDFGNDFSHPGHLKPVEGRGSVPRCADCHQRLATPIGGREMSVQTGHTSCFKCHGEKPVKPPSMNQCAECHLIDGPRSPNLFRRVRGFKHADHELDTRPRFKKELQQTRVPDYLCSECHKSAALAENLGDIKLPEASHCNQCHTGKPGLPDPLAGEVLDSLRRP